MSSRKNQVFCNNIKIKCDIIGPTGIQGPVGENGYIGGAGSPGAMGKIGPYGINGQVGPDGLPGINVIGIQGLSGEVGLIGPQGEDGIEGFPGEQGRNGITGEKGSVGSIGHQGKTGPNGPIGVTGPNRKFEFIIDTATSPCGESNPPGEIILTNNETVRIWSKGTIDLEATKGSVLVDVNMDNIRCEETDPIGNPEDVTRPILWFNSNTRKLFYWDYLAGLSGKWIKIGLIGLNDTPIIDTCAGTSGQISNSSSIHTSYSNGFLVIGPDADGSGFISAKVPILCPGKSSINWQMKNNLDKEITLGDYSVITNGKYNTNCDLNGVILGGINNSLGDKNKINECIGGVIVNGIGNSILIGDGVYSSSVGNIIINGNNNNLLNTSFCFINSKNNTIEDSRYCSIIGNFNKMKDFSGVVGTNNLNINNNGIISGNSNKIYSYDGKLISNNFLIGSSFNKLLCNNVGIGLGGCIGNNIFSSIDNKVYNSLYNNIIGSNYVYLQNSLRNTIINNNNNINYNILMDKCNDNIIINNILGSDLNLNNCSGNGIINIRQTLIYNPSKSFIMNIEYSNIGKYGLNNDVIISGNFNNFMGSNSVVLGGKFNIIEKDTTNGIDNIVSIDNNFCAIKTNNSVIIGSSVSSILDSYLSNNGNNSIIIGGKNITIDRGYGMINGNININGNNTLNKNIGVNNLTVGGINLNINSYIISNKRGYNSLLIGGNSNNITESYSGNIINGSYNQILNNDGHSIILNGKCNKIINGISNKPNIIINSNKSYINGNQNTLVSGSYNTITGSYSLISGGSINECNMNYNVIICGGVNKIVGNNSVILGGAGNNIYSTFNGNIIIGGSGCKILSGALCNNAILGGNINTINSDSSTIVNGRNQNIYGLRCSAIINSYNVITKIYGNNNIGFDVYLIDTDSDNNFVLTGTIETTSNSCLLSNSRLTMQSINSFVGNHISLNLNNLGIPDYNNNSCFIGGNNNQDKLLAGSSTLFTGGYIHESMYSIIGVSKAGSIFNSYNSTIVTGRYNNLIGTCNSFISNGNLNSINNGNNNCILTGIGNSIKELSFNTTILNGIFNEINNNNNSSGIINGFQNIIDDFVENSVVLLGGKNTIKSNDTLSNGYLTTIENSQRTSIINGNTNECDIAIDSMILNGLFNKLNTVIYGCIINGNSSFNINSTYSNVNGLFNNINNVLHSYILSGKSNNILSSNKSIILTGTNNIIIASGNILNYNQILTGKNGLIGIGTCNTTSGLMNTIITGCCNIINGRYGTISGGVACGIIKTDDINVSHNTVLNVNGGGLINNGIIGVINGSYNGVIGGNRNKIIGFIDETLNLNSGKYNTIITSDNSKILGQYSALVSGVSNYTSQKSTVILGGNKNKMEKRILFVKDGELISMDFGLNINTVGTPQLDRQLVYLTGPPVLLTNIIAISTNPFPNSSGYNDVYIVYTAFGINFLALLNPYTMMAILIGFLNFSFIQENIVSIAFRDDGVLYGVTDGTSFTPNSMFIIDITTANLTFLFTFTNNLTGNIIAYNHIDDVFYRWSGDGDVSLGGQIMEEVDPNTFIQTPITQTGDTPILNTQILSSVFLGDIFGLNPSFISLDTNIDVVNGATINYGIKYLLITDINGRIFLENINGVRTQLTSMTLPSNIMGATLFNFSHNSIIFGGSNNSILSNNSTIINGNNNRIINGNIYDSGSSIIASKNCLINAGGAIIGASYNSGVGYNNNMKGLYSSSATKKYNVDGNNSGIISSKNKSTVTGNNSAILVNTSENKPLLSTHNSLLAININNIKQGPSGTNLYDGNNAVFINNIDENSPTDVYKYSNTLAVNIKNNNVIIGNNCAQFISKSIATGNALGSISDNCFTCLTSSDDPGFIVSGCNSSAFFKRKNGYFFRSDYSLLLNGTNNANCIDVVGFGNTNINNDISGNFAFGCPSVPCILNNNNQFKVSAIGDAVVGSEAVLFWSEPTMTIGVRLDYASASWAMTSNEILKCYFQEIDTENILEKLCKMEICEWSYKETPEKKHIGPFANEFYENFKLGTFPTHIGKSDAIGIKMACIHGLYKKILKTEENINILFKKNHFLEKSVAKKNLTIFYSKNEKILKTKNNKKIKKQNNNKIIINGNKKPIFIKKGMVKIENNNILDINTDIKLNIEYNKVLYRLNNNKAYIKEELNKDGIFTVFGELNSIVYWNIYVY